METETRFDLNRALENWRCELESQPALSAEDRRELETHLRESMAHLGQCGVNEEESFWLARRRMGAPSVLAKEFVKSDPAKVWRERAMWIVAGLFAISIWQEISNGLSFGLAGIVARIPTLLPDWVRFYIPSLASQELDRLSRCIVSFIIEIVPVIFIGLFIARGRMAKFHAIQSLSRCRLRFICFLLLLALLACFSQAFLLSQVSAFPVWFMMLYGRLPLQMTQIALIAWLMPAKSHVEGRSPAN